jgi:hypothetical protein
LDSISEQQDDLKTPAVQIAVKLKLKYRLSVEEMWKLAAFLYRQKSNNEQHLMQIAVKEIRRSHPD